MSYPRPGRLRQGIGKRSRLRRQTSASSTVVTCNGRTISISQRRVLRALARSRSPASLSRRPLPLNVDNGDHVHCACDQRARTSCLHRSATRPAGLGSQSLARLAQSSASSTLDNRRCARPTADLHRSATRPAGLGSQSLARLAQSPSSMSFCCRSMNSFVESMPRWFRTKLRTAASTSTARLRPAATGIVTLRTGTSRISW